MKLLKYTLPALIVIVFNACGKTPVEQPESEPQYNILFIGNSYCVDATEHLPGMLYAAGIKNIKMARAYHGACTLPLYESNYQTENYAAYHYKPLNIRKWQKPDGNDYVKSLEWIVNSDVWDIVVLQEGTGQVHASIWNDAEKSVYAGLISKIREHQPDKPFTAVYMMTQVLPENQQKYTVIHDYFDGSQEKMYQSLVEYARKVMAETECKVIIPVGTAIQNLRSTPVNINDGLDMTRDYGHLDYGIARYTASCTVWDSIILPLVEKSLEGNSYRDPTANSLSGSKTTPITDENVPVAMKSAELAVANPYETTPYEKW